MTDVNALRSHPPQSGRVGAPTTATGSREQQLLGTIELLFFAYRGFTSGPDDVLAQYGFGRAHHRVLHFVERYPGLKVAQLLDILRITKQSLGRVLRQLVEQGFIEQRRGETDGRERLLHATPAGSALARKLMMLQMQRLKAALGEEEADIRTVERFLFNMIAPEERDRVLELQGEAGGAANGATARRERA
jgi:DNA-binding MarR family transcriptional regulator